MTVLEKNWIRIGTVDEIPLRGARVVKTSAGCIAVFRSADNEVYAIDDRCPHKAGPLSQGIVHGRSVTCPLHNLVINLEDGNALGPDEGAVQTYKLRVQDGEILLDTSTLTDGHADER